MFKPKVVKLGNMKVVLVKTDKQSIVVEAMIGSGSREEKANVGGVAHFLEHMCGRGTVSFPGPNDLGVAVDWVGGARNAYTSHEDMGFWTRTAKEKFDLALKIVSEQVRSALLPEDQIEKERTIIAEEFKMYEDDPSSKSSDLVWSTLFGKSGLGRPVLGSTKSLQAITRDDLLNFRATHFKADNTILGVVGEWDDDDKLINAISLSFGDYVDSKLDIKRDKLDQNKLGLGQKKLIKRKVDQAHLSIALPTITALDERRYALSMLNIILGSSWSSRLYKEIRLKRGLAYSVGSGYNLMLDAGAFFIGGGISKNALKPTYELIGQILADMASGSGEFCLTKDDLAMARECYKGRVSFSFDSPEKVMSAALGDISCGREIRTADDIKAAIDKITLDDLNQLANELFVFEKATVAVVGDFKSIDDAL